MHGTNKTEKMNSNNYKTAYISSSLLSSFNLLVKNVIILLISLLQRPLELWSSRKA